MLPAREADTRFVSELKATIHASMHGLPEQRQQSIRRLLAALPVLYKRSDEELSDLLNQPQERRVDAGLNQAEQETRKALLEIGAGWPDSWPLLAEALRGECPSTRQTVATALARALPAGRERIWSALTETPPAGVTDLLVAILPPWNRRWFSEEDTAAPNRSLAAELVFDILLHHPNPAARAVALSLLMVKDASSPHDPLDLDLLRNRFEQDRDPLVRSAAIRIAGFIGAREGNIDLKGIMLAEPDKILLCNAIEARGLWSLQGAGREAFELCEGAVCDWLPDKPRFGPGWSNEEVSKLDDLLLQERDPRLRDAASGALAERYRDLGSSPLGGESQDLKVHEWGVWLDQGGALKPSEAVIADLPIFVHRSEIGAMELWNERSYCPMAVTKPVIYFYAAKPMSLLLKVGFFEGRPWTFFPHATDYEEMSEVVSAHGAKTTEEALFRDRPEISPTWILQSLSGTQKLDDVCYVGFRGLPPLGLRPFFRGSSWTYPGHDLVARDTGQGSVVFTGMGIEWCGLRVGFPNELEPSASKVSPAHWWSALREVPSSYVAVRGESERFVFYDGAVNVPSPVVIAWEDSRREALLVSTRSFGIYPDANKNQRQFLSFAAGMKTEEKARKRDASPIPAVLLIVKTRDSEPRGRLVTSLGSEAPPVRVSFDSLPLSGEALRQALSTVLQEQGLTAEETRALLLTWEKEHFQAEGVRALTVIPRWLYDAMLPLRISPTPWELVRVGIIWSELTTKM